MKFEKKHLDSINNLLNILKKIQVPGMSGEEMLVFAQSYYNLYDVKRIIEQQQQAIQAAQQQKIQPTQVVNQPSQTLITDNPQSTTIDENLSPTNSDKKTKTKKAKQ